jgi:peptidoglycan/LPS O-acetylase OafA/YrhL
MSVTTGSKERFHFLDGLRGTACLMIIFHHAFSANIQKILSNMGMPFLGLNFANFTQSGVELFFVLSGAGLLRPYLRGQKKFNTFNYFFRRIKRIYPPYLVALLFGASVCWYIHAYPTWYNTKVFHLYFSWPEILKESVIINFDGGYYSLSWWSLNLEMFFYFLVPLILIIFPARERVNNKFVFVAVLITLIVSVSLQLWLTRYYPSVYSYKRIIPSVFQFICFPVCFLMGIFLAAKDFGIKEARIFIITGLVLVSFSWFYQPIMSPGYGLVYAGVITLSFNRNSFKHFFSKPIMIWIGERSYSLFLVHFSVFYLMDAIAARFTASASFGYLLFSRGVGIPVALFIGMLLFNSVERWEARGLVTVDIFWPWQVGRLKINEQTN